MLFTSTRVPLAFSCSDAAKPALFTLLASNNVLAIAIKPPTNEDSILAEPRLINTEAIAVVIKPLYIITLNTFDVLHGAKTTSFMAISSIEEY